MHDRPGAETASDDADAALLALVAQGDSVVSAVPHDGGVRYRVVSPAPPAPDAEPVVPNLEDGYLALAQNQN